MKVVAFLLSLCTALVLVLAAPIIDQTKRDVPLSVITPSNGPFSNNKPSGSSFSDFPTSKAPIPVNPFDSNPPNTAQPGDVPSSNVPVSKAPLPINPFDNNSPLSAGFPSSPNITTTINVPGTENGSPTANVIACDGLNFTGACVRVIAPLDQCGKRSVFSKGVDSKRRKMSIMLT